MTRSCYRVLTTLILAAAGAAPASRPADPLNEPKVRAALTAEVTQVPERSRSAAKADAEMALHAVATAAAPPAELELPARRTHDDATNRTFVRRATLVMHDFKLDPPAVTRNLMDRDRREPLTGPALELLADLQDGQIRIVLAQSARPPKR